MASILIAGCGYVGTAAADLFHRNGWEVEGWTASAASAQALAGKPYRVRRANLSDPGEVAAARATVDAVIHCASSGGGGERAYRRVYLDGARNLAAEFPEALLL